MNSKPRWTAFLTVLAYCAVAVLALNSYQTRFPSVAGQTPGGEGLVAEAAIAATDLQAPPAAEIDVPAESKYVTPRETEMVVSQSVTQAVASNAAQLQSDNELLGCLAADLARTAMKEGSIVLPRQIVRQGLVKQEPKRTSVPAKLVVFRLPRSAPQVEPPRPASLLVNYQSRLLAATTEVRASVDNYLRWVRLCAAVRDVLSDFEKKYLNPVLDRVLKRYSMDEVFFDFDYRTFDMTRYAIPVSYQSQLDAI